MKCLLSIDQGTTSSRAILYHAENFSVLAQFNEEYTQHLPRPGHVEHDLNDIWRTVCNCIKKVLKEASINGKDILAIGITNQRETVGAFDSKGRPLAHALVWQDRRTQDLCAELKKSGKEERIKKKTGLTLDPYFSATKINWLLNNIPTVKDAQKNGELHFGTIDTFLLFKLTSGKSFKTDYSNASRTLLMDLKTGDWDHELLDLFHVDKKSLPEIADSFGNFGETHGLDFLPDGIPVTGILGDQQAALFGQGIYAEGGAKCTYGTGAFMLLNTGSNVVYSQNGLLTTVAYGHNKKLSYAIEGSCYMAGAVVQWLRDNLKMISKSAEIEDMAKKITDLNQIKNLVFLPFFTGMGSPHWKSDAKAAIVGMTRDTRDEHLALAALEGIALSINDLIGSFEKDFNKKINELRVDGGAVRNNLLMELQASFSQLQVLRPKNIETTALGAAFAAAIGIGKIKMEQITGLVQADKKISSTETFSNYCQEKKILWQQYIKKLY